ncbi:MAG TPA: tetratricopeptide repeat protein [Polyangiales bacterium]|nr:tetratricopeptide repeat protein [Polyangiales bacterium]
MQVDDGHDIDPSQPMSLSDAMLLGTRLHRLNLLDEAYGLYTAVLEAEPEHSDALQFLGILEHQRHNDALALDYMQRAVSQVPDAPGVHHNLGNILLELRRFDEAAGAYQRCTQLGGETAELLNNIGILRRQQGRFAEAEAAYRRALALDPESVDAYNGYGRVLERQKRPEEALKQYQKALQLAPKDRGARYHTGMALCVLERFDEAAKVFRDWLAVDPDNPSAKHYLAACTGKDVPQRASDAYVASTFDDFAQSFDAKLESLHYRAPELVADAVRKLLGEPAATLDILDAGCGTGLCGPKLRPYALHLLGVDLSAKMLEKAKRRADYHELHKAELTAFIEARPQSFDLIVSADTLCYFGDLTAVCAAAERALRPGGRLIFTVEALGEGDYKLHSLGRYSHAQPYLRRVLETSGFELTLLEEAVLRSEFGSPVHGYVIAARSNRS